MARALRWLAFCAACALFGAASAQQASPPYHGVYAAINMERTRAMIQRLSAAYGSDRREAIREVRENAAAFMPPVLYALADALAEDYAEEAIFWYQVGRLRAVYDALRCRDRTARAGLIYLRRQLSPALVRILAARPERALRLASSAVEWDAANPQDYDHRWIALFGRVSRISSGDNPDEVTVGENEWPAIRRYVHETHLKSVREFASTKNVK
jgi:hypothetical protein